MVPLKCGVLLQFGDTPFSHWFLNYWLCSAPLKWRTGRHRGTLEAAPWRRHLGGGTLEAAPWRRHLGGGTLEAAPWRRHLGGGTLGAAPWRRHLGGGTLEAAPWRRHLGGGTLEAAPWRRHLGGGKKHRHVSPLSFIYLLDRHPLPYSRNLKRLMMRIVRWH